MIDRLLCNNYALDDGETKIELLFGFLSYILLIYFFVTESGA